MKIFDKYSLLCISVALIILITVAVNQEEPQNDDKIGIAHTVKGTQSGYTFILEDGDGIKMKCFTRIEPNEYAVYAVRGSLSGDGSIFFVSSMNMISQNELYRN